MKQYHTLLQDILKNGNFRGDRTGTGTQSLFGYQIRFDLQEGFPLLTTKKLSFKNILVELLWFLRGDTNIKYLLENGCHIWSADAYRMYRRHLVDKGEGNKACLTLGEFEYSILHDPTFTSRWGDLGPVYGKQWRKWEGIPQFKSDNKSFTATIHDQIKEVIESIRKNPEGRRHIVTAWNPGEINRMALPPCHCLFQFYVADGKLSCHLYQRSADVFLGVPFNIASYALLTHIIAHQCGLDVGELVISFGDVHIYNNHRDQVVEQLNRTPRKLPKLTIAKPEEEENIPPVDGYILGDFVLEEYDPYPTIKGDLSVGK